MNVASPIQLSEKLYNLSELEDRSAGNREFLVALAGIFVNTIPANSRQIVDAAHAEEWPVVSKLSHKIKSTLDSMRVTTVTTEIRLLENEAKKTQVDAELLQKTALKVDKIINLVAQQLKEDYGLTD